MKIYTEIPRKEVFSKSAITIGSFDGIHIAHKKIFEKIINKDNQNIKSVVVTFFPIPSAVLFKNKFNGHLNSRDQKISKIKEDRKSVV